MPAASEPAPGPAGESGDSGLPELPLTLRPRGVRLAVRVFGGLLLLTVVLIWVAFPDDVREAFTTFQRVTVVVMGLMLTAIGWALSRCRIEAREDGLRVVNGYRTHRLAWPEVVAVTMRSGNPWAVLDLSDGTSRAALGIQGSDGARARQQVALLRALIDAHAAPEPPR